MSDLARLKRTNRRATTGVRYALRILSRNRINEEALMAVIDTLKATKTELDAQPALIDSAIANAQASDSPELVQAANDLATSAQAVTDKLKGLQAPVVEAKAEDQPEN